ncbi:GAF domain-containing protein [Chlorogloeopsis fritschii]|uniref:GAF domain-containing protein n=1 Tax=Chlorogloeopsis fritschii TaxID=1124 RepID=UPI003C6C13D4
MPAQVKYSRKNTKVSSPTPNQQNIHLGANTSSTLGTNLIAIERSLQRNHHYFQNQNDTAVAEFFLEKILYIILEYVRRLMSVDTSTVLLQTQDQQELAVIATIGLEEEKSENIHIPVGKGFAGQIAANCTHMNINDLSEVEVISPVLRNKGIRSILGVPMIVKKRAIGVLHIGTFHSRQFTEKETEMLQFFANHIAYHFFTEIS